MRRSCRTALTLLLASGPLAAQQASGPLVLRLPGGTRALALGDAFVAGRGAEVMFYNPAQIAQGPGLMLSAARYRSEHTHAVFAATTLLGAVTVGFGAQYLGYTSSQFPMDPGDLGRRGLGNASSLVAGTAVSLRWKGLRWGAGAKYAQEELLGSRWGRAVFDFGVGREVNRFTVGMAVQHVGQGLALLGEHFRLPTRVSIGALLPRLPIGTYFDIGASAAVARERDGRIAPGAGVELYYLPLEGWSFVLRAGARRPERGPGPTLHPLTLGAGVGLDRVVVDYAFEAIRGGGSTHRVGIRIQ